MEQRDFVGSWAENGIIDLPQSVAKLTATIAMKNWSPESRIQHVISRCGATVGPRIICICDFEATSEHSTHVNYHQNAIKDMHLPVQNGASLIYYPRPCKYVQVMTSTT